MKKLTAIFILTFFCCNLFAQNIPSYIPTNGLVGWWPFNGNANDESGNGNNGTVNGATLIADRLSNIGSAYYFNGSSYIRVLHNNTLNFGTNNYTLSAWSMRQGNNSYQDIISKMLGSPSYTGWGLNFINNYPRFEAGTTNNGSWLTNGNINNGNISGSYTNPISNDLWYHFVAVFNPSNSIIKLYINGELAVSEPTSTSLINADNSNDLFFGVYQPEGAPSGSEFLIGKIDDIAIYNRALTQEEVTSLYQGSSTNNSNNGSVGINTTTPHPSAALDITDTQRGLLIPRMTASQRNNINNPAEGLMVFQTDDSTGFWYYSGQKWNTINSKGIKGDQGLQGQVGPQGIQGEQGIQGVNGSNGYTTLVNCIAEPSGSNCINGGIRVDFGIDENRNNILDSVEVNPTQTKYICNGAVSQTGSSKNVRIGYGQSGSWTCPQGVYSITVELWGAGGGGQQSCSPGAYGGSGGYIKQTYNVIPGNTYSVIVGAGGSTPDFRGSYSNCDPGFVSVGPGGAGGISSFDGELIAEGGLGGSNGVNGRNGAVINWQYSSNGTTGNVSYIPNSWVQNPPTGIAGGGAGSSYCGYSFIACSSAKGENGYCIITY